MSPWPFFLRPWGLSTDPQVITGQWLDQDEEGAYPESVGIWRWGMTQQEAQWLDGEGKEKGVGKILEPPTT